MAGSSDGLRLALTTLTVAPVPRPSSIGRRAAGAAMVMAPFVGLLVGLLAAAGVYLTRRLVGLDDYRTDSLLPAVVGITLLVLLTRGLHLDGLADTTDGLASYRPPAEARTIMRAGPVGPLGAAAIVLVLLLQVSTLSQAISAHHGTAAVLVSCLAGRAALPLACRRGIAAADETGLGATVAGTLPRTLALGSLVGCMGLAALVAQADVHTDDRAFETVQAMGAVLVAVVGAELLRRHCSRRLGGLTGDVLGALVEVGTTLALLVMSVTPPHTYR